VIGRRAAARPAAKIRRVGVLRPASAELRAGRPSRGAGAQRGAPREIPVERPTQFSFLINQTTAPALEVTIPASRLARADEVIQR